ncbi:hypothetical protein L4C36_12995 [Photobacterium japonica]|uniref:hypothetical protein n=1 Tax=Photobacterium japonica TaxID=2910235 RepID=UPI003D136E6B
MKFTEYAMEKLLDLYNNHDHEVGIELKRSNPEKYKDYTTTDCITYALNVLSYAFEKSNNQVAAKHVWSLGEKGTELAKYLVRQHGWKGVYVNPDENHPLDESNEHPYTSHIAITECQYYNIPVHFAVQNYSPTHPLFPGFQKVKKHAPKTKVNNIDIKSLSRVKFGVGISRGGKHVWLFSKGKVYEVHWDTIGKDLYEATNLKDYHWLSSIIVIPHDQGIYLSATSKVKC